MKIGLFGYGKMGKVIEKIALNRGHEITARVTSTAPKESFDLSDTDVIIEFSRPENAIENIHFCLDQQIPVVVGTTGWYEELEAIEKKCKSTNGGLLHATNFSLGVNIYFEMNKRLAKIMSQYTDYTAEVIEVHHTEKLDAPSGTGITTCEGIIEQHPLYNKWENVKKSEISDSNTLSIVSERLPNVPGTHEVKWSSSIDTIELNHIAHSREGFGVGAVMAAEFLKDNKGTFTMRDVLKF
ncbi:MAG: 4-hydroxy-tetrahydrodipicolinate reductase [Crocinitomicaceae bacterium]